jgi:protein gp37
VAGRFLFCKPLLGLLSGLDLEGVDWMIVSGEPSPNAIRPASIGLEAAVEVVDRGWCADRRMGNG